MSAQTNRLESRIQSLADRLELTAAAAVGQPSAVADAASAPASAAAAAAAAASRPRPQQLLAPRRPTNLTELTPTFSRKKTLPLPFPQHCPDDSSQRMRLETEKKLREIMSGNGILTVNGQPYRTSVAELNELDTLGYGTSGHVVRMRHPATATTMAVKQMRRTGYIEEDKRIIMDIDVVLKSHDCPYIVQCLGYFITESDVWICMELMQTCFDKLLKHATQPVPESILGKITVATVRALSYLKEKHDVIHRDIKPSNILIDAEGNIKLCDFGISGRLVDSKAKTRSAGCAAYMAPERIDLKKTEYDIRADVWSLGITLIELATGANPYKGCNTDFEVLASVMDNDPPSLPKDRGFSEDFQQFVAKCLTKDHNHRPKYPELLEQAFIRHYERQTVDVRGWFAAVNNGTPSKPNVHRPSDPPPPPNHNPAEQPRHTTTAKHSAASAAAAPVCAPPPPSSLSSTDELRTPTASSASPASSPASSTASPSTPPSLQTPAQPTKPISVEPQRPTLRCSQIPNFMRPKSMAAPMPPQQPPSIEPACVSPPTPVLLPRMRHHHEAPRPPPPNAAAAGASSDDEYVVLQQPSAVVALPMRMRPHYLKQADRTPSAAHQTQLPHARHPPMLPPETDDGPLNPLYKRSPFAVRRNTIERNTTDDALYGNIAAHQSPFAQRKLLLQQQQQQQQQQHPSDPVGRPFDGPRGTLPQLSASPLMLNRKRFQTTVPMADPDELDAVPVRPKGNTSPIVLQRFYHQQNQLRERQDQRPTMRQPRDEPAAKPYISQIPHYRQPFVEPAVAHPPNGQQQPSQIPHYREAKPKGKSNGSGKLVSGSGNGLAPADDPDVVKKRFASYVKLHLANGSNASAQQQQQQPSNAAPNEGRTHFRSASANVNRRSFGYDETTGKYAVSPANNDRLRPGPSTAASAAMRHRSPDPPPRFNRGQSPLVLRRNLQEFGNGSPMFQRRYTGSPPMPPPRRPGCESVPGSPLNHHRHHQTGSAAAAAAARIYCTPEPQRHAFATRHPMDDE